MPSQSIAFIYKSLGCLHSLQPIPADNGYSSPSIPALKAKGFVTWQTIQLLLGPEEHVPFIQNALRAFNVVDPQNGKPFPKLLPKEAFPSQPDEHMVAWHGGVSERLRIEAQAVEHEDAQTRASADVSADDSADERADAAKYFSNPFYRSHDGRAAIVRHITNAPARVMEGGKMVARTIQTIADPHLWSRRRSLPDRRDNDEELEHAEAPSPTGHPSHRHRTSHGEGTTPSAPSTRHQVSHARSKPERGPSQYSSESLRPAVSSHHQVRRNRSHDPPPSPREYFAGWDDRKVHGNHRQHQQARSMANRVGQGPLDGRSPNRGSGWLDQTSDQYARGGSAQSVPSSRYNFISGVQNPVIQKYIAPVNGVRGRRYPNETPWR